MADCSCDGPCADHPNSGREGRTAALRQVMFNDPDWVKRFLTARTVARCWDSARAVLSAITEKAEG